ncbi:MAG: CapA family protein [Solobacterium sp.]|nr:CapA family protein [Solobacterium sp.]
MAGNTKKGKRHLRKSIKVALIVLAVALCGAVGCKVVKDHNRSTPSAGEPTAEPSATPKGPSEVKEYHASMFMTGDALIHGAVYRSGRKGNGYDFSGMVDLIAPIAQKYDLRFYNQETTLGGTAMGLSGYPRFNSPQEWGDAMVGAGFNLVSTANNHSLDKGFPGIEASLNYWRSKEGVVTAGTYLTQEEHDALPVYEINGITYTFLAWTCGTNGLSAPSSKQYIINDYQKDMQGMIDQVKRANEISDVVIVSIHWGQEYVMNPNEHQQMLARQLVDAGADIIVGNHPHVIQPIEKIGDAVCFYAMGNFISAQAKLYNYVGMMGAVDIHKTVTDGEVSVKIENVRADLIYTWMNSAHTAFRVIPFSQLTDKELKDHEAVYEKYKAYITKMDPSIQIGGVE